MVLLRRNGAAWEAARGPLGLMTRRYEPTGAPSTKRQGEVLRTPAGWDPVGVGAGSSRWAPDLSPGASLKPGSLRS